MEIGLNSFKEVGFNILGTGITIEVFNIGGTLYKSIEAWKIKRKIPHSSFAQ